MKRQVLVLATAASLLACSPDDDGNRVVGELASDRIELTAEYNEAIVEITVSEGQSVAAGDILLRQNDARGMLLPVQSPKVPTVILERFRNLRKFLGDRVSA